MRRQNVSCHRLDLKRSCPDGAGRPIVGPARGGQRAHDGGWERRMLNGLRTIAHLFNQKIGFSRLGVALSVTIIVIAVFVLYHILRDIDVDALHRRARGDRLADARHCRAFCRCRLHDPDLLRSLRAAHDRPRRGPLLGGVLGSFTSYAVGHNVGASVFSGGAVRYRIYSAWGLSVVEVTKICFVAGLTFWLGNAAMLGLGDSVCSATGERHRPAADRAQPHPRDCDS